MRVPIGLQSWPNNQALTSESLINCYAEQAPATARTPVAIRGTPGLISLVTLGTIGCRGMAEWLGNLYAVYGNTLYKVTSGGGSSNLGTILGTGPVSITGSADYLVIGAGSRGYTYDGTTLAQITDSDLNGAAWVDFLDNYIIFGKTNSGQFQWSDLADATSISGLSIATAEGHPDFTVRGIVDHREVMLFGSRTTEIFYNTGDADNTFLRVGSGLIERGCAAGWSVAKEDNSVFWLGDDKIVYRLDGRVPVRVSTSALEDEIDGYAVVSDAEGFFYTFGGGKFYVLTFPDAGKTWAYNLMTGLWHQLKSWGQTRWRASWTANAHGRVYVGSNDSGDVYYMDDDTYTEDGNTHEFLLRTAFVENEGKRISMPRLEAHFEFGTAGVSQTQADVMLKWSNDGFTWSDERTASLGLQGNYGVRATWHRLGQFRRRSFELRITDPVPRRLFYLAAEVTPDEH